MRVDNGGGGPSIATTFKNIASAGTKAAAKKMPAKRKSSYSGASRGAGNMANTVRNVGRSVARSSRSGYSGSNQASRGSSRAISGSYSRPATGSTSSGRVVSTSPPPPVAPKRLTDNEILAGDTVYQGQNASYAKALQDYAAQYAAEKAKYTGEYDATKKQYGTQQQQGATDLLNDYASRGLSTSGLYADALSQYTNDWNTKYADLDRARNAYFGDLGTAQTNFQTDQSEQLKAAKQQAIQRYLDKLGA